jgi:hypothetical protein
VPGSSIADVVEVSVLDAHSLAGIVRIQRFLQR